MALPYGMQVFIFASESCQSISAFTSDDTGANLPAAYAPWRAVNGGRAMAVGGGTDPVARAVERDGYFLLGGHSRYSSYQLVAGL